MPKRLSDITYAYRRTNDDLETAQDILTKEIDRSQARVNAAAEDHRQAHKELAAYLEDHEDVIVVASDTAYFIYHGILVARPIIWAHHVWVEDPPPAPSYRVPPSCPLPNPFNAPWPEIVDSHTGDPEFAQMAKVNPWMEPQSPTTPPEQLSFEPRAGEADLSAEGEAALAEVRATWDEPNGAPVTIDDD